MGSLRAGLPRGGGSKRSVPEGTSQVSSDPHNPTEHAEAQPASGEVLDQTAPVASASPAQPPLAYGADGQPEAGGLPLPGDSGESAGAGEAGAGLAEVSASTAPGPSAQSPEPPAQPEDTPAEVPPESAQAAEEPAEEAATAAEPAEVPAAEPVPASAPASATPPRPKSDRMDWYILKVQSNREESIREGLRRRIAVAGYEHYFGDIIIPMEKVTEVKAGKKRTYKRKLYPGYLMVQMEINEDTWFLVRETPGIGDFTGAGGHPTPMNPREVQAILATQEEKPDQQEKVKINFRIGDRVKIKEGTFESFEGEVSSIDETNGRVTVLINIFGRSTPVDIEYWQIEAV